MRPVAIDDRLDPAALRGTCGSDDVVVFFHGAVSIRIPAGAGIVPLTPAMCLI